MELAKFFSYSKLNQKNEEKHKNINAIDFHVHPDLYKLPPRQQIFCRKFTDVLKKNCISNYKEFTEKLDGIIDIEIEKMFNEHIYGQNTWQADIVFNISFADGSKQSIVIEVDEPCHLKKKDDSLNNWCIAQQNYLIYRINIPKFRSEKNKLEEEQKYIKELAEKLGNVFFEYSLKSRQFNDLSSFRLKKEVINGHKKDFEKKLVSYLNQSCINSNNIDAQIVFVPFDCPEKKTQIIFIPKIPLAILVNSIPENEDDLNFQLQKNYYFSKLVPTMILSLPNCSSERLYNLYFKQILDKVKNWFDNKRHKDPLSEHNVDIISKFLENYSMTVDYENFPTTNQVINSWQKVQSNNESKNIFETQRIKF